jgi:hypothetical protein
LPGLSTKQFCPAFGCTDKIRVSALRRDTKF